MRCDCQKRNMKLERESVNMHTGGLTQYFKCSLCGLKKEYFTPMGSNKKLLVNKI